MTDEREVRFSRQVPAGLRDRLRRQARRRASSSQHPNSSGRRGGGGLSRVRALSVLCGIFLLPFGMATAATRHTWLSVHPMHVARVFDTATLLPSGKILVTGGQDPSYHILSGAELYDPRHDAWTVAAPMHVARLGHTATLLPTGQVLVVGGDSATAELYDPRHGTWTPTEAMHASRIFHTATLLPDGRVLVAGGGTDANPITALSTAEVYDPRRGTWARIPSMHTTHFGATATLLRTGQVLVAGGETDSVERYDPRKNTWTQTAPMHMGRMMHTATLLPTGQVFVTGGYSYFTPTDIEANAELYDPHNARWTVVTGGRTHTGPSTATLLSTGQVLVMGGCCISVNQYLPTADLFDPRLHAWTPISSMHIGRAGATATLLPNGQVVVAGGWTASTEIYR